MRRSIFAAGAHGWLTVPSAHDLVLFRRQRPTARTLSNRLERLRRAASRREPCVLLVSLVVVAVREHAKRSRELPCSGSVARCSGTECPDLRGSPQIYPAGFRHGFVIYMMCVNFPVRGFNFQCDSPELFMSTVVATVMK